MGGHEADSPWSCTTPSLWTRSRNARTAQRVYHPSHSQYTGVPPGDDSLLSVACFHDHAMSFRMVSETL
jgi:hypothetical protein